MNSSTNTLSLGRDLLRFVQVLLPLTTGYESDAIEADFTLSGGDWLWFSRPSKLRRDCWPMLVWVWYCPLVAQ